MKKIFTFMAAAMLVAAPALFTSCDDDPWYDDDWRYENQWWYGYDDGDWGWDDDYWRNGGNGGGEQGNTALDEAEILNGEWDGIMDYTDGSNGQVSSFYANMTFVRNSSNAIKGTGTEVDYTLDNNKQVADQQTLKFNWYIDEKTGDIYIHYLTSNNTTFVMDLSSSQHHFILKENEYFRGYMIGTNNKDMIYFNLNRVTNNEAKKATRAAGSRSYGSSDIEVVKGGMQRLNNNR